MMRRGRKRWRRRGPWRQIGKSGGDGGGTDVAVDGAGVGVAVGNGGGVGR